MREIKFRAKDITDNWCYGQLIIGNNYDFIITKSDYDEVVATLSTLVCQCHPIKKGSASIGEFTGLQDKNGKDIYEGDILIFEFYDIGKQKAVVYWNEKYASFLLDTSMSSNFEYTQIQDGEIIGNIYDNPELVKGE